MILYNEEFINWAEDIVKIKFSGARAIGFSNNGIIQGGVIFDNYTTSASGTPLALEASVVVVDKRCITRQNMRVIFDYPFNHCKVKRLCLRSGRYEMKKRELIERLGFTYEGIARESWPFGGDAAIYSMLRHECKWIA